MTRLTDEERDRVTENHNLIYWYINLKGIDKEEWYDLLAIELCMTIRKYDATKGSLANYFKLRADSLFYREHAKSQSKKRVNNGISSLDELHEIIADNKDLGEYTLDLGDCMTSKIVRLRIEGYNQTEIAEMLEVTQPYISKLLAKYREELQRDR